MQMKFYLFSICNILFELFRDYFDLNQMNNSIKNKFHTILYKLCIYILLMMHISLFENLCAKLFMIWH